MLVDVAGVMEIEKRMNNIKKYCMSFTTGGLFQREAMRLTELYQKLGNWESASEEAISQNLLQARTLNSSKRVCREIVARLRTLGSGELDLFVDANLQEQRYLLWLAVCRRYQFIGDFAIEVLRERFITLKTDLSHEDFDSFFNRKSDWHDELDQLRPATKNKLRQVLFRILREADLVTETGIINAAMLSPRLLDEIPKENRNNAMFFPAFDADIRGGSRQ